MLLLFVRNFVRYRDALSTKIAGTRDGSKFRGGKSRSFRPDISRSRRGLPKVPYRDNIDPRSSPKRRGCIRQSAKFFAKISIGGKLENGACTIRSRLQGRITKTFRSEHKTSERYVLVNPFIDKLHDLTLFPRSPYRCTK